MDYMARFTNKEELITKLNEKGKEIKEINKNNLETHLKKRVLGQDNIISEVGNILYRRWGARRPSKPIAVLFLVGPTGVGKTELCKAITEFFYNSEKAMVRFDMSEFDNQSTISRLIGAPAGYVGYEDGGQLTKAMFAKKERVVLFDEIEKAHPKIFDLFLQIFDEARLSSGTGAVADFSKSIIVLTSNLEHEKIKQIVNTIFDPEEIQNACKEVLSQHFRREILGRMDRILVFRELDYMATAEIVCQKILKIVNSYDLKLQTIEPNLIIQFMEKNEKIKGFGVRELERIIENDISDELITSKKKGADKVSLYLPEADSKLKVKVVSI